MNDPKLYDSCHGLQAKEVTKVLSEYINSMSWKTGDRVLDVGCGPGGVTAQVLMPRLPSDFGLLVGADLSADMIQYASKTYTHPKLRFTQFDLVEDIGNTSQLQASDFDKIFSFFCLHWIPNQRKAVRNINSLLRTGGETLHVLVGKSPVYEVYEIQCRKPEWEPYLKDVHQFISPYHHSSDPAEEFSKLLHDTGFEVIACEYGDSVYVFETLDCLKGSMKAINPFLGRIPRELHEQYMTDYMKELLKLNTVETNDSTDGGGISFKNGIMVAFARKT